MKTGVLLLLVLHCLTSSCLVVHSVQGNTIDNHKILSGTSIMKDVMDVTAEIQGHVSWNGREEDRHRSNFLSSKTPERSIEAQHSQSILPPCATCRIALSGGIQIS